MADHLGPLMAVRIMEVSLIRRPVIERFHCINSLEWTRISCFGHNLDLAVNEALAIDCVHRAVKRCCLLVEIFSRSWKKARDLQETQKQLGLPEHKLIGDVATRCGSTYHMVSRVVEQQQAICAVLAGDQKNWDHMPSANEFSIFEAVVEVFKLSLYSLMHCPVKIM